MSLFDEQFRLEQISEMGDPLERLNTNIDFESYRALLEGCYEEVDRSKGGRKPFDRVMMFKCLVLKSMFNLSFEKLEYQIKDRLSFQRFVGMTLSHKVPDANTFWDFNEALTQKGVIDDIFVKLTDDLRDQGLIVNKGSIIDASIVDAPIQRNTRQENAKIKEGHQPKDWSPDKAKQKDTDADWTTKNGKSRFGYKNHIKVDKGSKLITNFEVTSSSVHDSQMIESLLEQTDSHHELYGDSAYRSEQIEQRLKERKIKSRIHKKGYRNKPLKEVDQKINTNKSKIRARVEHVFGDMHQTMGRVIVRQIGMARNVAAITMMNIAYNMRRSTYLKVSMYVCIFRPS